MRHNQYHNDFTVILCCCAERFRTLLADHDVYITDWHNARDVPAAGRRVRSRRIHRAHHDASSRRSGPGAHLLAVCQPCVAGTRRGRADVGGPHPATPASMVLMAGPIDCRIAPTRVNKLATRQAARVVRAAL